MFCLTCIMYNVSLIIFRQLHNGKEMLCFGKTQYFQPISHVFINLQNFSDFNIKIYVTAGNIPE